MLAFELIAGKTNPSADSTMMAMIPVTGSSLKVREFNRGRAWIFNLGMFAFEGAVPLSIQTRKRAWTLNPIAFRPISSLFGGTYIVSKLLPIFPGVGTNQFIEVFSGEDIEILTNDTHTGAESDFVALAIMYESLDNFETNFITLSEAVRRKQETVVITSAFNSISETGFDEAFSISEWLALTGIYLPAYFKENKKYAFICAQGFGDSRSQGFFSLITESTGRLRFPIYFQEGVLPIDYFEGMNSNGIPFCPVIKGEEISNCKLQAIGHPSFGTGSVSLTFYEIE